MKFLVFADYHFWPDEYKGFGTEGVKIMQKAAEEAGCDMIIHAGDFCHGTEDSKEIVELYNNFHIPSYHCLGNHEMDHCSTEETLAAYKMPNDYYYFDMGGYRFVVTNTSYFVDENGEFQRYSNMNYFNYAKTRETLPPEEIEWIRETIDSSPYPCILVSHSSFEREVKSVINRKQVLKIIDDANKKKKHSVLMCINGHHHTDHLRILNSVLYFDVNSTCMQWLGSQTPPHNMFPEEDYKKHRAMGKTLYTNDPLFAIITLEGTTVTIEGRESTMYCGITRETLGMPMYCPSFRERKPVISSAKITLH